MMEDTDESLDNDSDDDEPEEKAPPKRAASNKDSERKKRELITMGKAKGFLTYDEVNDHMPETIVSSDQIDDWLSTLGGEGIEIVDSTTSVKVSEKRAGGEEEEEEEDGEASTEKKGTQAAAAEEEEETDGYSKTNDPVRMYLRKM